MSAIEALDGQLLELRRLIGTARALCYTGRPEEDTMAARHDAAPGHAADSTPAAVHVKRADGLDVEVSGSAPFVKETLAHVLAALGIVQTPPPA